MTITELLSTIHDYRQDYHLHKDTYVCLRCGEVINVVDGFGETLCGGSVLTKAQRLETILGTEWTASERSEIKMWFGSNVFEEKK